MSEFQGDKRGLPDRVKMRHDSHFVEDLTAREIAALRESVSGSDTLIPEENFDT